MASGSWSVAANPNSRHQLWSRWTFRVLGRRVALSEIETNFGRWCRKGFGSVGRARVRERVVRGSVLYLLEAEVEGAPAHDPGYVDSVRRGFRKFCEQGFGILAVGSVKVKVLAGDEQNAKPPSQLVVMPTIWPGAE